jgi:hypothetical protein
MVCPYKKTKNPETETKRQISISKRRPPILSYLHQPFLLQRYLMPKIARAKPKGTCTSY